MPPSGLLRPPAAPHHTHTDMHVHLQRHVCAHGHVCAGIHVIPIRTELKQHREGDTE